MTDKNKTAAVHDVINTVGLQIRDGAVNVVMESAYELTKKYTVESAGVLKNFPPQYQYTFFSGRAFQKNKKGDVEYFPVSYVITEFFVDDRPFYVSGDNFHRAVEQAILMQNYMYMMLQYQIAMNANNIIKEKE